MTSSRRMLLVAGLGALAALAGAWVATRLAPSTPTLRAGTWLPQARPLQPFALRDDNNQPFGPTELAAQPSLLFFGFTQCPDVCPTTLAMLAQLHRDAGLEKLRVVLVSVDPERDTPAVLKHYVSAFDTQFIGLTGSSPEIASLLHDVGVAAVKVPLPGGGYTVDHSATLFLTDTRGRIAAVFTAPFAAAPLRHDLQQALPALGH